MSRPPQQLRPFPAAEGESQEIERPDKSHCHRGEQFQGRSHREEHKLKTLPREQYCNAQQQGRDRRDSFSHRVSFSTKIRIKGRLLSAARPESAKGKNRWSARDDDFLVKAAEKQLSPNPLAIVLPG
jgi:hypothetical protein